MTASGFPTNDKAALRNVKFTPESCTFDRIRTYDLWTWDPALYPMS